jgi:hypothetical protein
MRALGIAVGVVVGFILGALAGASAAVLLGIIGGVLGALVVHPSDTSRRAPTPVPPMPRIGDAAPPADLEHEHEEWTERFLAEASRHGVIDQATRERLSAYLLTRTATKVGALPRQEVPEVGLGPPPPPSRSEVPAARGPVRPEEPIPAYPPMPPMRPAPPRAAVPSPAASWFARMREAVVSDVAVHGLAYLGVFLVFAGILGFLLFSFESLSTSMRPYGELAIPTVLLGSAWFLRRRGAPVVATALGLVGGVLLPVVLFASYVDGAAFPPDFDGAAVGWAVIGTSIVLAAAYAVLGARRRDISVRLLVAPMLWTAVWGIGLLLPGAGRATLEDWSALQWALVSVAVAATAVVVRVRPDPWWSHDARRSLIPGAALALGLTLLLDGAAGWSAGPLVLVGLATLVTSEALSDRLGVGFTQAIQPPLLWLALAGLRLRAGDGWAGPVAVVAALALLEWQDRRRPGPIPVFGACVGTLAGIALAVRVQALDPWSAVAAAGVLAGWAHARRSWPLTSLTSDDGRLAIAGIAALAPAGVAAALVGALPDEVAFIALAFVALLVAGAIRGVSPADPFFGPWAFLSTAALGGTVALWPLPAEAAAIALGTASVAVGVVPTWRSGRAWACVAGAAGTLAFALAWAGVATDVSAATVAIASLGAATLLTWIRKAVAAHAGLACITAGSVAIGVLVSLGEGWLLVAAMTTWTVAFVSAAVAGEARDVGVVRLLTAGLAASGMPHGADLARGLAAALALAGAAATLLVAADVHGVLASDPARVAVGFASVSVAEAAGTWLVRRRTPLVHVVANGAFALAVAAAAGASVVDDPAGPSAITLALAIAAVVVTTPVARHAVMTWAAWAMSGGLVIRLAELAEVASRDVPLLVGAWSAFLGLGALALDDARAGRRPAGAFVRTASLLAPAAIGVTVFPFALALSLFGSNARIALVCLAGAAVVAVAAALLRLGALTSVSYALVSAATALSSPWSPADHPWLGIAWAAALGGVAWALREVSEPLPLQRRWDAPAALVALGCAGVALWWSVPAGEVAVTWGLAGVVALVVAWALRSTAWAGAAVVLIEVGAGDAGHGWSALALGAGALGLAAIAPRLAADRADVRVAVQGVAAALALGSLLQLTSFADWSWTVVTTVALTIAASATAAGLVLHERDEVWAIQAGLVAVAMQGLGTAAAVLAWPERGPAVAVLLTAAIETAAAGVVLNLAVLAMASPALVCGAWLVGVGDLIEGDPMWWTMPIGLALLAIVGIGRWFGRHRETSGLDGPLVVLDVAGMATLLIPPLVQTVTRSSLDAPIAIGVGLAIAVWGTLTKVRRRLFMGIGGVVTAVVLMIAGPIADLVPKIERPVMWVLIVLAGVVLLIVATSLERGRARVAAALKRLDELLGDWE